MKVEAGRLLQLTTLLNEVSADLERLAAQSPHSVADLDLESLRKLKAALDNSRHVVWPLVLAKEQEAPHNVALSLQLYRMERIREMLANLQKLETAKGDAKVRLFLSEVERSLQQRREEIARAPHQEQTKSLQWKSSSGKRRWFPTRRKGEPT